MVFYMYMFIYLLFVNVVLMFMMGVVSLVIKRLHIMTALVSLEFMSLAVYSVLVMTMSTMNFEKFFLFLFISLVVCEGAVGLSLVVKYSRKASNLNLGSSAMLKW